MAKIKFRNIYERIECCDVEVNKLPETQEEAQRLFDETSEDDWYEEEDYCLTGRVCCILDDNDDIVDEIEF